MRLDRVLLENRNANMISLPQNMLVLGSQSILAKLKVILAPGLL